MTPDQRAVISEIKAVNETLNSNIAYHGGRLVQDPNVVGEYFPRLAKGREGEAFVRSGQGRRIGTTRSPQQSATYASIEEGIAAGIDYDSPWNALLSGWKAKGRIAEDSFFTNMLKALSKPIVDGNVEAGWARVQHPAFAGQQFRADVAERIDAAFAPSPDPGIFRTNSAINAILTPLRATADVSYTLNQGLGAIVRSEMAAGAKAVSGDLAGAAGRAVKPAEVFFNVTRSLGNDDLYYSALGKLDAAGPGIDQHVRWGAHYQSAENALDGEFLLQDIGLLKKLPGVGPTLDTVRQLSNRHFARMRNVTSLELGNALHERLTKAGVSGDELTAQMREGWNAINRMGGWSRRKGTFAERHLLFAPKFFSAAVEQLGAAMTRGGLEGAEARRHLGGLLGMAAFTAFTINTIRGYETEFDPRSSNFLRLRNVAGRDISLLGPFDTIVRYSAQTVFGQPGEDFRPQFDPNAVGRFARAKLAPVAAIITDVWRQETFLGESLNTFESPAGFLDTVRHEAVGSLPFGTQNLIEETAEGGIGQGLASFGIGSLGASSNPLTPIERRDFARDEIAQEMFGSAYDHLTAADKSVINQQERVAGYQAEADRNTLTRGGDRGVLVRSRLDAANQLDALSAMLEAGQISGTDFRRRYADIQLGLRSIRDALGESDDSGLLGGWFALYDDPRVKDAAGQIDYDVLDGLQAQYREAHPDIDRELLRAVGAQDNATMRDYRRAQQEAAEYYAISPVIGMETAQAQLGLAAVAWADDQVRFGMAPDRNAALVRLAASNRDAFIAALLVTRLPANPEREQFRHSHPLFARFYGRAVADPAAIA